MTAKEYLKKIRLLDIKINQKVKELDELRSMSQAVRGIDYSKECVQTSLSSGANFEKSVIRISELERLLDREIDYFVDLKHKIINQIQSLDNRNYADILYKRYIEFKRLELIAVELGYSYNRIRHLHGEALKYFDKLAHVSTQ